MTRMYRFPKEFLGLYISEKGNKLETYSVTTAHRTLEDCWKYFKNKIQNASPFNIPLIMRYSKYLRIDYSPIKYQQIKTVSLCISQGGVLKYARLMEPQETESRVFGALDAFCAVLKDMQVVKIQRLLDTKAMQSNIVAKILLESIEEFRKRKIALYNAIEQTR